MSLISTILYMVFLIILIRGHTFTTTAEDLLTPPETAELENYNKPQNKNLTSITSNQPKDKHINNKLLSPKNTNIKDCNKVQTINVNNKDDSEIKTLLQSQIKTIRNQNITIKQIYQEFENAANNFMDEPDTIIGESAINLGNMYLGNSTNLFNTIKEHNSLIHTYECINGSKNIVYEEIPLQEINEKIKSNKHIIGQFEYLFNLTLLRTEIYYENEDAVTYMEEYNDKRDLESLRKAITSTEKTKELIQEYLPYLEQYYDFLGNREMHENFNTDFMQHVTDKSYWEEMAANVTRDLENHKKYLSQETHRILIQEKIQPAAQGIIFIVGFVWNFILFIIFVRHKEIRNPQNMMILNLAIGDAFNLIINIPTFYSYFISSSWDYGDELCKVFRFSRQLGIAVSVYSVVMISIQRFLALTQIFKGSGSTFKMTTKFKSALTILSVWIIAALLATPHTIHAGVYNGNCYGASSEDHQYYTTFITLFDFILFCSIPVVLIVTLSLSAAHIIKRSVKNMPGESIGMDKLIKTRILSSNVLIALTIVSIISYVPLYMFMLIYAWSDIEIETSRYIVLFFILYTLSFANCCFNPIALYIFSRKFRTYFNVYFLCRKLTEDDESSKQTSTGTNISTLDTKM